MQPESHNQLEEEKEETSTQKKRRTRTQRKKTDKKGEFGKQITITSGGGDEDSDEPQGNIVIGENTKQFSTNESVTSQIVACASESPELLMVKQNLNEDINMQLLYGQISMFDQLTDYNDDDDQTNTLQHRMRYMHQGGKGEDDADNDDEAGGDLYVYRNKIQAINDELANFIGQMTEGGQGEDCFDEDLDQSPETSLNTFDKKELQLKFKRIMKFMRTLDSELTMKQQQLDQREHAIAKLTREKGILQELLESKSREEEAWIERDREQKALIDKLLKEKEELKAAKPPRLSGTPVPARRNQSSNHFEPNINHSAGTVSGSYKLEPNLKEKIRSFKLINQNEIMKPEESKSPIKRDSSRSKLSTDHKIGKSSTSSLFNQIQGRHSSAEKP